MIWKIIIFSGKLNSSKGFDLFGKAVIKILEKFPEWRAVAIGNEPREKFNFEVVEIHNRPESLLYLIKKKS